MAVVEVIVNPTASIATVLVLLVSATALAFLAVIFLCGFNAADIEEAEE